ncbi:MAG: cytochrome c-type biogenesis protein CcmH [Deltaproteobacteria bacterium]|nr:cytochrome c-type biogenesis protein CcmH [Deltaproteobacteria bacterium]
MSRSVALRYRTLFLALLFAVGLGGMVAADEKEAVSFQDIEESLTCQCGCGLTVHSCNHLQCGSALPLRDEIREQMSQGKDKLAILAHFSEKYGEKILSAPTTTGFNLIAWVTPFLLVALGGVVVAFTLMRWRAATKPAAAPSLEVAGHAGPKSQHEQTLERDLKNFDA